MTTKEEAADVQRSEDYWRHKACALLLPTPLAELDEAGEAKRAEGVRRAVGLTSESFRHELHQTAERDARDVHVLERVRNLRSKEEPSTRSDTIPMRALVHPLSGQPPPDAVDEIWRLDDLVARYDQWFAELKESVLETPPNDSSSFSLLWHELYASTSELGPARWISRVPGDPLLRDHTWLAVRTMASALVGARFDGGDASLLHVHCGPVQSFIEAARRTSDLWLGSYLISFLAYQATKEIARLCGPDSVIYPHLATLPLAQLTRRREDPSKASHEPSREEKQQWLRASQPNRFVAVVDGGKARDIATVAARAVLDRWTAMGHKVKTSLTNSGNGKLSGGFYRFEEQIAELLELDIVVQPWPSDVGKARSMLEAAQRLPKQPPASNASAGDYYEAVFGLGRDTLGAQRRVLSLSTRPGDARIKCTQCGRREAMGPCNPDERDARKKWKQWWEGLRSQVSGDPGAKETVEFRRGESLCAVCLTKRLACRFDLAGGKGELGLDWNETDRDRPLLRFPSVASIAAAPLRLYLLEQAAHDDVRRWVKDVANLHRMLGFTEPGNLLPGLGDIGRGSDVLDYDGTWLYARSYELDTILSDHDLTEEDLPTDDGKGDRVKALEAGLPKARGSLAAVGKMLGSKNARPQGASIRATPYYAVIVIDVDEMGHWLDGTHEQRPHLEKILENAGMSEREARALGTEIHRPISSSLHTEVSRRQGEMAASTLREIVENTHLGRVVYSGGDDVLAFVPLHTLWRCLRDIEAAFTADAALGSEVTLSAGVAIYDWRSPLSLALRTARKAEGKAKQTKGCVVVNLEIRSGAPIELRLPWKFYDDETRTHVDLLDVSRMVEELVAAGDQGKKSPLLRPSAAEVIRRELDTLRHQGLGKAFAARVAKLLQPKLLPSSDALPPWIRLMMKVAPEKPPEDRPRGAKLLARKAGTAGQVVELLLLLRFLAREHGGMAHDALYTKIDRRRARRETR